MYACKGVFNPNITIFLPNFAEGLHFSAFHLVMNCSDYYLNLTASANQLRVNVRHHNYCKKGVGYGLSFI